MNYERYSEMMVGQCVIAAAREFIYRKEKIKYITTNFSIRKEHR